MPCLSLVQHVPCGHAPSCYSTATGEATKMPATPVQAGRITIPQRLNNVPHQRETRQFFYQDACAAVRNAVSAREPLLSVKWAALPPLLQSQGRNPNAYWV